MPRPPNKTKMIHIRATPQFQERLEHEARRRVISVSEMVTSVMSNWLDKHGGKRVDAADADAGYPEIVPAKKS